jgi:hypothetical protein
LGAAESRGSRHENRDRAKQNRPLKGRYGSSSVGSSAFRAVGCPTRRQTQRSSTACRKCAKHIQVVPARQPLSAVIIREPAENLSLPRSAGLIGSVEPTSTSRALAQPSFARPARRRISVSRLGRTRNPHLGRSPNCFFCTLAQVVLCSIYRGLL